MTTRADEQDLYISDLINVTRPAGGGYNEHIQGLYNWRDVYTNLNTYYINDVVSYNNNQYIRISETPGSELPTDPSWQLLPGTNSLSGRTVMSFTFRENSNNPWIDTGSNGYITGQVFIFEGSDALGTPSAINVVGARNSAGDAQVRIADVTNGTIICENTSISAATATLYDLGTLSNIPTGRAIWELQFNDGTSNRIFLFSLSILL